MRKCISVLLCVILLLSLCTGVSAAENPCMDARVTVNADSGRMHVKIFAAQTVSNARISVSYDPDYLTFVGVAANQPVMSVKEEAGLVTVGLAWSTAAAIGPGELVLDLGFDFTGGWDKTELTVSADRWNGTAGESVTMEVEGTGYRFTDVRANQWFYEAVEKMAGEGHIKGMTETTFGPDLKMNRAMFVTILGRIHGVEDVKTETRFSDVKVNSFYSGYVAWADENGIVKGIGGDLFAPDMNVTREQLATFLYRYASFIDMDVTVAEPESVLAGYTDADQVSTFARDAIIWAVDRGYMKGMTADTLGSKQSTTRAQATVMLYRFFYGQ